MKLLAALVVAAMFVGCQGCPPQPGPIVNPTGAAGASPSPNGPATCLDLCRHGADLGCPWAADTPAGATCVDVCSNNQSAGIATWDLDCRTTAATCAAVDRCR